MRFTSLFAIIYISGIHVFGQVDDYIHYNFKDRYEITLDSMVNYYLQKDYPRAAKFFERLNQLNKKHAEAVYIYAIDIYKNLGLQAQSDSIKRLYTQKTLEIYDVRATYFNKEKSLYNRKLFDYFLLMYQVSSEQDDLFRAFTEFFQKNSEYLERYNIIPYADLARKMKLNHKISEAEFLSIIDGLHSLIDSRSKREGYNKIKTQLDEIAFS